MSEWVNIVGGLVIASTTVLVTWLLSRHKPQVDRRTADVAENQLALDSLKAVSLEWREYASAQAARAEAAEAAARTAAAAAKECRDLADQANARAEQAERYNRILLEHWPDGHALPNDKGDT